MPSKVKNILAPFLSVVSIGLDIGSSSVKVAQLKKSRFSKAKAVLSLGSSSIQHDVSASGVVDAVKAACRQAKTEVARVNLSVSGSDVIMRYITMPAMKSKDLSSSLHYELERYIPGKSKDMVVDFHALYKLPNNQMLVLLIAAERRVIEERVRIVREAGFEPQLISVDALSLIEAFSYSPAAGSSKEVTAVLDVGYASSKLVVFQQDLPNFSRDISTGVRDFIQLVCERKQLEPAAALEILTGQSADAAADAEGAVRPDLSGIIDELRLSFEYCQRNLQKRIEKIFLCGGGTRIQMLSESLEKALAVKTAVWDPIQKFGAVSGIAKTDLPAAGPSFAVALGLALS